MTAKRMAGWAALAGGLWLLVAGAAAQEAQRMAPGRKPSGEEVQRMMPVERRLEQVSPDDGVARGRGHGLSPEERRQLRRDVHEAGRDLYPHRMPPGRRDLRRE